MPQQIKFFEKNIIDIDTENIAITITDSIASDTGQDYVDFLRNRNNDSLWATTDSTDAANTQIDIDMTDTYTFDRILLLAHNFKAFTIQYHNGSIYTDFSTAINETTNTEATNEYSFTAVLASKIRIIITGAFVVDDDKFLKQLLVCASIGQLEGWPKIDNPTFSISKKQLKLLSGKSYLSRQRGNFSATLSVPNYNVDADLDIIEAIYFSAKGVLIWINAGDSTQFSRTHIIYRPEDIFLVQPKDEFSPALYNSFYQSGIELKMGLVEVVR